MDSDKQRPQIKAKRAYKRRNLVEISVKGQGKKKIRRKDSAQLSKQIQKRPYNKRPKDQLQPSHKGRTISASSIQKGATNLIHIEVGTTQVKQNVAKNSQFNPKGLLIIDKLSEFANNYLQNPPRNEDAKKKKMLIEDGEWNVLSERKKKYYNIANSYSYLKYYEENSSKDKVKKLNDIPTPSVLIKISSDHKKTQADENQQQIIQSQLVKDEPIMDDSLEIEFQDVMKQEFNQIEAEEVNEQNKLKADILILDDEQVKEEENEPKQEDQVIKEENQVQGIQQIQDMPEEKEEELYEEKEEEVKLSNQNEKNEDIFIITEQIQDKQKLNTEAIFDRLSLQNYLQQAQSQDANPSIQEKFIAQYKENKDELDSVIKQEFVQLAEKSAEQQEGIKDNRRILIEYIYLLEDILQSYDMCIDKPQSGISQSTLSKSFFDHVLHLTTQSFDHINSSFNLSDQSSLTLQKLASILNISKEECH